MSIRLFGPVGRASAAMALGVCLSAGSSWAGEPPLDGRLPADVPPVPLGRGVDIAPTRANDAWLLYEGPRMRYEQPRFAGDASLYVREDVVRGTADGTSAPGVGRWRVYRGHDLDGIAKANADLAASPDLELVRTYVRTNTRAPSDPLQVTGVIRTRVEAPGLVYEPATMGTARLYVSGSDGRELLYTGSDFGTIVASNPTLEQTNGFSAFRTRVQQLDGESAWTLRGGSPSILFVTHTPTGVVVSSNEWRDGRWVAHRHEGKTMAELRANQAELQALLEANAPASSKLDLQPPVTPAWDVLPFGFTIATPMSCLDSQLNLEGRGLVVTGLRDGSTASNLGFQTHDVILEIDGRAVTDREWARTQFASWRDTTQTKVVVLRKGQRVTLGR